MIVMVITLPHFFTPVEILFVSILFFYYGNFLSFPIQGQGCEVFPHARFFGKIPEQSEDDFCENRFSGLTLLVEKNT